MARTFWRRMLGGAFILATTIPGAARSGNLLDGSMIHACVSKSSGTIKIVDSPEDCGKGEESLSWNLSGPAGPVGPAGPEGPAGPQGIPGADGVCDAGQCEGGGGAGGAGGSGGAGGGGGAACEAGQCHCMAAAGSCVPVEVCVSGFLSTCLPD